MRLLAVALIALGILAVVYGGFWYPTKDAKKVELGPVEVKIQERSRVNVPVWVGVASIVGGVVLLTMGRRRA